jgi:putative dimethyl sulfoxide reductase chaperone
MEYPNTNALDDEARLTLAVRDFFIAQNAAELRTAVTELPPSWQDERLHDADWDQAEFAFNRLFVGPMALEAPPYASIYLEDEPQVMGRTTMLVRSVYEMVGLVSPWKNTLPDDHVSLELDAALALHRLLQAAPPSVRGQVAELRGFFLEEHVQVWMPRFCARIEAAPSATPVLLNVAAALRQWLGSSIAGHGSGLA